MCIWIGSAIIMLHSWLATQMTWKTFYYFFINVDILIFFSERTTLFRIILYCRSIVMKKCRQCFWGAILCVQYNSVACIGKIINYKHNLYLQIIQRLMNCAIVTLNSWLATIQISDSKFIKSLNLCWLYIIKYFRTFLATF